ncbi:MAG: glycosyltransferase family 2 protein [Solirubrobacteraceae bacterium]
MTDPAAASTTVVVPVWDAYAGALLDAALDSIREQAVPVRIVLVDNASSVAISEQPDVEVVRLARRLVLGAARNAGIERVQTPFVVVWDADDLMLPGTLALLEREMRHAPQLVAYGAAIVEAADGTRHRWPRRWIASLLARPRLLALVQCVWSVFPSTGATIMRTALVREAGGYPPATSGDDWVLGVSLAFRGPLGWTERPGRSYRRDPQSIWACHSDAAHQRTHARDVRRRIRADPGIASWARAALPAIAVAQHAAIVLSTTRRRFAGSRRGRSA